MNFFGDNFAQNFGKILCQILLGDSGKVVGVLEENKVVEKVKFLQEGSTEKSGIQCLCFDFYHS